MAPSVLALASPVLGLYMKTPVVFVFNKHGLYVLRSNPHACHTVPCLISCCFLSQGLSTQARAGWFFCISLQSAGTTGIHQCLMLRKNFLPLNIWLQWNRSRGNIYTDQAKSMRELPAGSLPWDFHFQKHHLQLSLDFCLSTCMTQLNTKSMILNCLEHRIICLSLYKYWCNSCLMSLSQLS